MKSIISKIFNIKILSLSEVEYILNKLMSIYDAIENINYAKEHNLEIIDNDIKLLKSSQKDIQNIIGKLAKDLSK